MTVREIVTAELRRLGAVGLCDHECGCRINDLAPCGCDPFDCVPAREATLEEKVQMRVNGELDDDEEVDEWYMVPLDAANEDDT